MPVYFVCIYACVVINVLEGFFCDVQHDFGNNRTLEDERRVDELGRETIKAIWVDRGVVNV